MKKGNKMAEIRIKQPTPELVEGLQKIALELRENTVNTTIMKLIPRYHDMKKRIDEQNKEIGELTRELREAQNRVANAGTELTDYFIDVRNFSKDVAAHLVAIDKRTKSFLTGKRKKPGTKKPPATRRPAPRKAKKVPSPKKKK